MPEAHNVFVDSVQSTLKAIVVSVVYSGILVLDSSW